MKTLTAIMKFDKRGLNNLIRFYQMPVPNH